MRIEQPAEQPLYRPQPHALGLFGNSHVGYQKLVGSDRLMGDLFEVHHRDRFQIIQEVSEVYAVTFDG
ncbi:MAG: hypothetical protein JKP90_17000 [Desulfofustis sp. PB-SRB1]|nr:hypothetical protein [Desulfofustis sp. PB-SRB1]